MDFQEDGYSIEECKSMCATPSKVYFLTNVGEKSFMCACGRKGSIR